MRFLGIAALIAIGFVTVWFCTTQFPYDSEMFVFSPEQISASFPATFGKSTDPAAIEAKNRGDAEWKKVTEFQQVSPVLFAGAWLAGVCIARRTFGIDQLWAPKNLYAFILFSMVCAVWFAAGCVQYLHNCTMFLRGAYLAALFTVPSMAMLYLYGREARASEEYHDA